MVNAILIGTPYSRNQLFWALQGVGWLGIIFLAVAFASRGYMDWNLAVLIAGVRAVEGIALSCVLRLIYRRFRTSSLPHLFIACCVLLLCLLTARVDIEITRMVGGVLGLDLESDLLSTYMRNSMATRWILYTFWSVLYFGVNYWLDTQQIQIALARAEASAHASQLKALKAQINPHFLFNALASILAESGDNRKIRDLTLALSDYLRFLLQQHKDKAPLGQELDALENYLRVEKARFEHGLMYDITADEQARAALAPASLVQPLLENAVKYGMCTCVGVLDIQIKAHVEEGSVVLRVSNSGSWVSPENNNSTKTGLSNLRKRLELVYGKAASLEIETGAQTVTIEVKIPAKTAEGTL